jgi:hypothetical protein
MLWRAGQKRQAREERGRLAELFRAVRDAILDADVHTGRAKARGTWQLPPYARPAVQPALHSPAVRDATLRKLGVMFPGIVRRSDA